MRSGLHVNISVRSLLNRKRKILAVCPCCLFFNVAHLKITCPVSAGVTLKVSSVSPPG